jgi:uncharacterized protein YbjQ (UPF0145 family)
MSGGDSRDAVLIGLLGRFSRRELSAGKTRVRSRFAFQRITAAHPVTRENEPPRSEWLIIEWPEGRQFGEPSLLYDARELAMERMQAEALEAKAEALEAKAEALEAKAEGIVGVDLHERSHGWGSHVIESSQSAPRSSPPRAARTT